MAPYYYKFILYLSLLLLSVGTTCEHGSINIENKFLFLTCIAMPRGVLVGRLSTFWNSIEVVRYLYSRLTRIQFTLRNCMLWCRIARTFFPCEPVIKKSKINEFLDLSWLSKFWYPYLWPDQLTIAPWIGPIKKWIGNKKKNAQCISKYTNATI